MVSTLACNADWLTDSGGVTQTGTTVTNCSNYVTSGWVPPYLSGYYYHACPSDARPIKLTLSEVEKLRKAAKADKALKAILTKFTGQIEITVDFE